MAYQSILTDTALAKIADAVAGGGTITINEMAVGDGGGSSPTPESSDTALVNEVYRAAINQVSLSGPSEFTFEMVIPVDEGGWTVREVGAFDSDGDLFAVAPTPEIYKPTAVEQAVGELIVRIVMLIDNAEVITVTVDYSVVTATVEQLNDHIDDTDNPHQTSAAQIIPGGLSGEILRKASNTDGDTEWYDPVDPANVAVDALYEEQTLAASQTEVTLAELTTTGLAVYVEGARLHPDTDYTVDSATQITLGTDYPDGTLILLVQNDPYGSGMATVNKRGFVELATLLEAEAGNDSERATTPEGVHAAFNQFGLGADGMEPVPDLNDLVNTGFYAFDDDTANIPSGFPATRAGVVWHSAVYLPAPADYTVYTQVLVSDRGGGGSDQAMMKRHKTAGNPWSEWGSIWDSVEWELQNSEIESGYQKLPGGLIVQWGRGQFADNDNTITFPITFPNNVFSIVVSSEDTANTSLGAEANIGSTRSTSQFNFIYNGGPDTGVNWIAIGN